MTKILPPDRYKQGDLIQHQTYGKCLIVGVTPGDFNVYDLVSETGYIFQMREPHGYIKGTAFRYDKPCHYANLSTDYKAGVFTPYFS